MTRTRILAFILAPLAVLLFACGGESKAASPTPNPQAEGRTALSFVTKSGKKPALYAELAQTIPELNIGLSKRDSLPPDVGMLFVLPFRGPGFWMKDTNVPLTVAFIHACGEIVGLSDMTPHSEQLHQVDTDYKFGLEANQGWFAKNGIVVGDKLNIPEKLKQPGCP